MADQAIATTDQIVAERDHMERTQTHEIEQRLRRMMDQEVEAMMRPTRFLLSPFRWEVRNAVAPPPALTPLVVPSKSAVAVSDPGCDAEYQALARELGIFQANLVNAELEAFLAENFIEEYPLESVKKYMDALCEAGRLGIMSRLVWGWHPLRAQDVEPAEAAKGGRGGKQYTKPVPYPVLQTVKLIADRFHDQVRFCVTDVERIPDPFLSVGAKTPDGMFKIHVIERWDEPKYRP
jgi:hypothetical protein